MNTKSITANQKLLAVIIGVAILATVGVSAASAQVQGSTGQTNQPPKIQGSINIEQLLLSNVKTNFSDAANTAATAVSNGKVIGGNLIPAQGYLVYAFKVIDNNNMVYSVIVDPSSGKVLYTSPGHEFNFGFGMGGQGGMKHGFKGGHQGGQWGHQTPQSDGSQSGTTNPSTTTPSDLITPDGLQ